MEAADWHLKSMQKKSASFKKGIYRDAWGCLHRSLQENISGHLLQPLIRDIGDWRQVDPPYARLPENRSIAYDRLKKQHERSPKFIIAQTHVHPWERYRLLRGSERALTDPLLHPVEFSALLNKIHSYYLKELTFWAGSEVDGLFIMDDWGSRRRLLMNPEIWRYFFKPLYTDYAQLAKSEGKFVFMHSDGFIPSIIPDLIEIGVDALNIQLLLMDYKKLAALVSGKITLWGQPVLGLNRTTSLRRSVQRMHEYFYRAEGGLIIRADFDVDITPQMVETVLDEWQGLQRATKNKNLHTI